MTPPAGGTPESTFTNSAGEETKLVQYLASTVDPTATTETTSYEYDPQGSLSSMTDNDHNEWDWGYNVLGEQTSVTDPDAGTATKTYDDSGNVLTATDARGVTIAYTYDALNRKTGEYLNAPGAAGIELASWAYDPSGDRGQLASSSSYAGSSVGAPGIAYTETVTGYDAAYRPTGQTLTIPSGAPAFGGTTHTVSYSYNAAGMIANTTYPSEGGLPSEVVKNTYDGLGNELSLGTASTTFSVASYNAIGELAQQKRTGSSGLAAATTAYGYDPATGNVAEIETTTSMAGSSLIAEDNNYSYDANGNVTSIAMSSDSLTSDTQCFSYDHLQNLSEAWTPSDGDCAETPTVTNLGGAAPYWDSYTVDPATGDRTAETQHAAAAGGVDVQNDYFYAPAGAALPHAIQSVQQTVGGTASTSSYGYDAAGDMTSRLGETITYDPEGKVSGITDGSVSESDIYDADGNLLLQTNSVTGSTLFNGPDELHVAVGSSTTTGTRTYSENGNPVAELNASTSGASALTWLIADAQGTVNLEVDCSSGTLNYRAQDPFGNARGAVTAWTDDHGFLNAPVSSFSQLTQLGARLYDSTIGKFLSVDSVLDPSSPEQANGYAYSLNNPVTFEDPSGNTCSHNVIPDVDGGACNQQLGTSGQGSSTPTGYQLDPTTQKAIDRAIKEAIKAAANAAAIAFVKAIEGEGGGPAANGSGVADAICSQGDLDGLYGVNCNVGEVGGSAQGMADAANSAALIGAPLAATCMGDFAQPICWGGGADAVGMSDAADWFSVLARNASNKLTNLGDGTLVVDDPVNAAGVPYPNVTDPRTGADIPYPGSSLQKVPKADRVNWTTQDRYEYIKEWHDEGYPTPAGGWDGYDIHHIVPREYGGTNDFWNLVPVERSTHQSGFTAWFHNY